MTSKERVKAAVERKAPDKVPVDFWAAPEVVATFCERLGVESKAELLEGWDIDMRFVMGPSIVGLEQTPQEDGSVRDLWGVARKAETVELEHGEWTYRHVTDSSLAGGRPRPTSSATRPSTR